MIWAKAMSPAATSGSGSLVGLLLLMEIGVPIPIPADLVMIFLGERVSAGSLPLGIVIVALQVVAILGTLIAFWLVQGPGAALLARAGPRIGLTDDRIGRVQSLIDRRGTTAVALGRSTPGLRTATVVATAGSGTRLRLLIALVLGSTLFLQGHFLLGLALGPAARTLFERATIVAVVVLAAIVGGGLIFWMRRRRGGALQSFGEACCPACIAVAAISERSLRGAAR